MAATSQRQGILRKALDVRSGEARALIWSFAYFFCLLACYYVLRPVRDEMGVRSGVRSLPSLFLATFLVSLAIAPVYGALVARLKRSRFIPLVYGFLVLNLLAFWGLLTAGVGAAFLQMAFFVWLTVFVVLAVSVFWSFMADLYSAEQAKRLYPTIAMGGSLGGFFGSATVTGLAELIGPANLLLVAAGLLGAAIVCALNIERTAGDASTAAEVARTPADREVGGGWLAGLATLFRSPYLAGIAFWVLALSLAGSFAYGMQNAIVGGAGLESGERTRVFATMDLAANVLAPLLQLLVARWSLKRLGVGVTLGMVGAVFAVGFGALALAPALGVLMAFQVAQRTATFALSNPAREALWNVVGREEKYKAKNVVDTAVFRGSDVVTIWLFATLFEGARLSLPTIALIGLPLMALWFLLSMILGRLRERRAASPAKEIADAVPA
jgi:ATP:ADP antiporter, AAA family